MTEPTEGNSTIEPTKEEGNDVGVLTKTKRWAPEPEKLRGGRDTIRRHFGLEVNMERLDQGEQTEALELLGEARAGDNGINLGQLSKRKVKKLEALIEKAADRRGHFKDTEVFAQIRAKGRQAVAEAMRRPPKPVVEVRGMLHFPAELLAPLFTGQRKHRNKIVLQLGDLGLFVFLAFLLENPDQAAPLLPHGASLREDGDAIVLTIDRHFGPIPDGLDLDGRLRWEDSLRRLENVLLLSVDRSSALWEIRIGSTGQFVTHPLRATELHLNGEVA